MNYCIDLSVFNEIKDSIGKELNESGGLLGGQNRKYINRSLRKLNKIPKPKNINRILTENISLKKDNFRYPFLVFIIINFHIFLFVQYMLQELNL